MSDGTLGEINTVKYHIGLTPNPRPFKSHPYRAGSNARKYFDKKVQRRRHQCFIEPAQCKWASPVVQVPKPDRYWQVPIYQKDRDKTTFICQSGRYGFQHMLFGLMNTPDTFQTTLHTILSGFKWNTCIVYIDDVIIFSQNFKSHVNHVDSILSTLQRAGVF